MAQIERQHVSSVFGQRVSRLPSLARDAIKWWAEHQAWPAIDEIRIEKKTQAEHPTYLRF